MLQRCEDSQLTNHLCRALLSIFGTIVMVGSVERSDVMLSADSFTCQGCHVFVRTPVPERVSSLHVGADRQLNRRTQAIYNCCPVSYTDRLLRCHRSGIHRLDLSANLEPLANVSIIWRASSVARAVSEAWLKNNCSDQYIEHVLKPGNNLLALQEKLLKTPSSDTATSSTLFTQAKEFREAFSAGMVELIGSAGMLSLEISYGRIGARDLKLLIEKSKMLSARLLGIGSFQVSTMGRLA